MSVFTRKLFFDFNDGMNTGGFYEVVLDKYVEPPLPGTEVLIGDSELERRGRIRCLVAIVEPMGEYAALKEQPR